MELPNWTHLDRTDDLNNLQLNQTIDSFNATYSRIDELINKPNSALLYSPILTIIISIVASCMSATTILGNILVITAFIIDKNLRKYSNYFILNLSIADLLIGLLIPPYAPFLLYNRVWKLGKFACTVWLVLDYVVGSASVLCIVVISLDRFLLVSKGLSYLNEQKISKAICIMITVWMIAFLNYAPAIVFWELISGVYTTKEDECQVAFHNNLVYLTATACVEFFVPLISICALNLAVYLNIRKRSRGLLRSERTNNLIKLAKFTKFSVSDKHKANEHLNNDLDLNNNNNHPDNKRFSSNEITLHATRNFSNDDTNIIKNNRTKPSASISSRAFLTKDKKAARSLFILVFVFVICWVSFLIG